MSTGSSGGAAGGATKLVQLASSDPASPPWIRYVAMLTGVLAALAGFLTVRTAFLTNDAIYNSNQGVLFQARASDAWQEYQSASIKANFTDTMMQTVTDPVITRKLSENLEKFRDRQPQAQQEALGLESQRDDLLKKGNTLLGERDTLQYAGMAIQLGIALASVAALTRRYDAFMAGVACGGIGALITGFALAMHFLHKL